MTHSSDRDHERPILARAPRRPADIGSVPRRIAARALLVALSLIATSASLEIGFRLSNVHVGTVQINRATIRPSSDPALKYELRPHGFARAEVDYRINADGYRGPRVATEKSPDTLRIAVIGDSIAFGYWVEEGDAFPRQLEQLVRASRPPSTKVEVLNFGVPGYDLRQEIVLLRNRVLKFRPDIVIVAYCLNDLEGTVSYELGLVQDRTARGATLVGSLREALTARSRLAAWIEYRLAELEARRKFVTESRFATAIAPPLDSRQERQLSDSLKELSRLFESSHTVGLLAIFPAFTEEFDLYRYGALHESVTRVAQERSLTVADLFDCFSTYALTDVRVDIVHPSPLGHRVAAHALLDVLCDSFLTCTERPPRSCTQYSSADFSHVIGY